MQNLGKMSIKEMAVQPDEGLKKVKVISKSAQYETELGNSDLQNLSPAECITKGT